MKTVAPEGDVGVIVGRFQVPDLHEGHRHLIDAVKERHNKVLICVGSTPGVLVTRRNPLDYHTRMLMLRDAYPDISILPLHDMPDDNAWSRELDRRIAEAFDPEVKAVLYGSRDGFIPFYNGKHPTFELAPIKELRGTDIRNAVSDEVRVHSEFRRGVVYAAFNRHPVAYHTVDVAVWNPHKQQLALGRKHGDLPHLWRFCGGFVDPKRDESLEGAARREAREEFGSIEIGPPTFIGSQLINDWRYRQELDKIFTSIFVVQYLWGHLAPSSDLDEAAWFNVENVVNKLVPQHRPIMEKVLAYLEKESNNNGHG